MISISDKLVNIEQVELLLQALVYPIRLISYVDRGGSHGIGYFIYGKYNSGEEWSVVAEITEDLYYQCSADKRFLETAGDANTDKTPGIYYIG